jgi:hypothetical protein
MALPPDAAVNQPLKPALARVGVPGDAAIEPPVMVVPSETALPPCESYVTVRVFAVHCAYRVKLEVWPCAYGNEMALPPEAAVNQPAKEYPARVGDPGEDAIDPPLTVVPPAMELPPCESYVTVNVFPVHCAYRVKLEVWPCTHGNEMALPPDAAVNQPAKAYPVRVGVRAAAVAAEIDPPVIVLLFETALPPCGSYVTVNEFAVHCAYSVKLAVWRWVNGNDTRLPPLVELNQPANVYPVRVGDPGDAAIDPPVTVVPLAMEVPPCESYVTVRVFAVHCAYRVTFDESTKVEPAVRGVPDPSAIVFQPANVYPARVIDPAPATVTVARIHGLGRRR